jgi:hypothetical protein
MADLKYVQCKLRSGSTERITWLRADMVRQGSVVTLKAKDESPQRQWRVIWVGSDVRSKDQLPDTDWRVGGLL